MKGILRLDNVGRLELVFKKPIFDLRVFDSIAAVTYEDVNAAIQELGEEPVRKVILGEAEEVEVEFDPSTVLYGGVAL